MVQYFFGYQIVNELPLNRLSPQRKASTITNYALRITNLGKAQTAIYSLILFSSMVMPLRNLGTSMVRPLLTTEISESSPTAVHSQAV